MQPCLDGPRFVKRLDDGRLVGDTIDGKAVAAAVRGEVRSRVSRLAERGTTVGLATVLVGDDQASQVYVGMKQKACAEVGIRSFRVGIGGSTAGYSLRAAAALIAALSASARGLAASLFSIRS